MDQPSTAQSGYANPLPPTSSPRRENQGTIESAQRVVDSARHEETTTCPGVSRRLLPPGPPAASPLPVETSHPQEYAVQVSAVQPGPLPLPDNEILRLTPTPNTPTPWAHAWTTPYPWTGGMADVSRPQGSARPIANQLSRRRGAPQHSSAASWPQTVSAKPCQSVRGGAEHTIGGSEVCRARFFELHEDRMRLPGTDVFTCMFLCSNPTGVTGRQLDLDVTATGGDPPGEGGQRDHHAVRMPMRRSPVSWPVQVLQHPHPIILEQQPIQLRIGSHRVVVHDLHPSWYSSTMMA